METHKKWIIGVLVLVVLAGAFLVVKGSPADRAPSYSIELASGESVSNWQFTEAYTGNPDLIAKAKKEIERLEKLVGAGSVYPDYELFVSIANQYHLMGDGEKELAYLQKALAIDSTNTGLAWHNAGQLFVRLGAIQTARMALEKAVAAQPTVQYESTYREFLKEHFPEEVAKVPAIEGGGTGVSVQ